MSYAKPVLHRRIYEQREVDELTAARDAEIASLRADYAACVKALDEALSKFPSSEVMGGLEPVTPPPGWLGRRYASDLVPSSAINEWRAILSTPRAREVLGR